MKKTIPLVVLSAILLALSSCGHGKSASGSAPAGGTATVQTSDLGITKDDLLKGCEIPARREFPIDASVNPCTDMYQYACNKVIAGFHLRDDRSSHTFSFNDSFERILYAKKKFLKNVTSLDEKAENALSPHLRTIHDTFAACMNEDASKLEEPRLVNAQIQEISQIHDRGALLQLLSDRIDSPYQSFVGLDSEPNQDNPLRKDALLDSELMTLPERSYYDKPEVMKDFEGVVTEFFRSNHLENPEARARAVVAFESDFAHHYPLPVEFRQRSAERNPISRKQLLSKYPNLRLARVLKRIPAATKFRNLEPETLEFLNTQLGKAPLETLKDFLIYHSARGFMDDAYPTFFKTDFEMRRKDLGGPEKRPDREERCTRMVMNNFGREIDAEMLPIFFPNFPSEKVVQLAEKIRASIIKGLTENKWLSSKSRAGAIRKMSKAQLLLVKPQTDDEWDFTPPARYNPSARYANMLQLRKLLIEKEIREYGENRNRRRWLMGPLTINAYYMPMDNTFVLPNGILQYPFYDPNLPEQTNLAAIGSVIGHELGHGIDDKGAKYDELGKLHTWMSPKDIKEFERRGGQFIARFEAIGHNGKLTLGENIADHMGLTFSSQAAAPMTLEEEKAFFTQYARAWCQVVRPGYRAMLLKTDPHAMGEARVNQQVRQQPGFQEAFACKPGDAMWVAPEDRIKIWQ
jgi:putative endopeptidase